MMTLNGSKVLSFITVHCLLGLVAGCGSEQKTTQTELNNAKAISAIRALNQTLSPIVDANVTASEEIDWSVGVLPWDRFTLPTFAPNGLNVAVQLGEPIPINVLAGNSNSKVKATTIELHILDPMRGRSISPLIVEQNGLILSRYATDQGVLVESPNGALGRSIGQIDWATGNLRWLVDDDNFNAFPVINSLGDLAWSRRSSEETRFQLVIQTSSGIKTIDDGKSDWLFPLFLGNDRLRAYRLLDGELALVEFDLRAHDPMQTYLSFSILASGASRSMVAKIATSNPMMMGAVNHAFYHPELQKMVVWQPNKSIGSATLTPHSIAAVSVKDGTWLVSTSKRVVRQTIGEQEGVQLRNHMAIPIATTSEQWTHLLMIPDGNRLQIRALNLTQE